MGDFNERNNAVKNALNECGVGENLDERLNAANERIAEFCADVMKRATRQAIYNELTNEPCGIRAGDPLRMGIVGAIGALAKWDIGEALEIAADIAEDVNAHSEAAAIRKMAVTEVS